MLSGEQITVRAYWRFIYFVKSNWKNCLRDFYKLKNVQIWLQKQYFDTSSDEELKGKGAPRKSFNALGAKQRKNRIIEMDKVLKDSSFSPASRYCLKLPQITERENLKNITKLQFETCSEIKCKSNLSRRNYEAVRSSLQKEQINMFSYKTISKKQSLDIKQFIESISNTKIKINIEHLVMNTFENLVKEHSINYGPEDSIKFILKWGGDGSNVKEKQFRGDSVGFSDNL